MARRRRLRYSKGMDREMARVIATLRASIGEAETLLNAIAKLEAEDHMMRISARAAKSVGEARARLDQEPANANPTQTLVVGLLELARTRLELFSVEFHSNLARETRAAAGKLIALIFGITGAGFAALAIAVWVGDNHRIAATAVPALFFVCLGAAAGWMTWRTTRDRERALELSLAEIERDLQELEQSEQASETATTAR
jgi:uncharacterized membrane protein YqjE